jgi:hypothetical protein
MQQTQSLHRKTDLSFVEEEAPIRNRYMSRRTQNMVMDLEETEARSDCAGEGQMQFN